MSVKGQDIELSEVAIRVAERGDVAYIFSRTLRDWRDSPGFKDIPDGIYHQYAHRALEHILTDRCVTWVAYPAPTTIHMDGHRMVRSSNNKTILGFVIADPTDLGLSIVYANTRRHYDEHGNLTEDYRRKGIFRKIVDQMIKTYECPPDKLIYVIKTPMFEFQKRFAYKVRKDKRITYNHFLFWTLLPEGWEMGIRKPSAQFMADIAG